MKKYLIFFFIFFLFCSKYVLEKRYDLLRKSLENSKSAEEKAKLIKDFLKKHPESSYTYDLIFELMDYEEAKEYEGFVNNLMNKIKGEDIKEDLKFCLIEFYKRNKDKDNILKIFNTFRKPLKYDNFSETIKALIEVEDFESSLELLDEVKKLCDREYINKEYEKLSEERRNRYFNRRNFETELLKGRTYFGLKDYENSLSSFEKAKEFLKPSFPGTYLDDFDFHYALLLKEMRKNEEAISVILPDVIYERNEKNYELFEKIYTDIYGSKDGIEDFLKAKKEEISPTKIDFTLKDYDGKEFNFFDLSKDKVTFLAFWFPT